MLISDDITTLNGIGEKTAGLFKKVGVSSVYDLLSYLPADYIKYPETGRVSDVRAGEKCALSLTITSDPVVTHVKHLTILSCKAADDSGRIKLVWYNMPYLKKNIKNGMKAVFYGTAVIKNNFPNLSQPKIFREDEYEKARKKYIPVYSLTKGLTSKTVNKYALKALKECTLPEDFLNEEDRRELSLKGLYESLKGIHSPKDMEEIAASRNRLAFNEFYFFIRNIRSIKEGQERAKNSFPVREHEAASKYIADLPYELTGAQKRTYEDILSDMGSEYAMNRLVQGDVGSGKTVVAMLAMISVIKSGYQAALMAPTEVLAAQHMKNLSGPAKELGIESVLLSGALTEKEKASAREKIKSGSAQLVIGTHALITDLVEFKDLALAITDEQHRFGVEQRKLLSEKCGGTMPHILVMSATPIPRTLAMIIYGDMDISVMDELPKKRLPIKNCVVGEGYRKKAWSFIKKEVEDGHQAYVICPLVEENENPEVENVTDYPAKLKEAIGNDIKIGVLHGRMRPKDKDRVMEDFSSGKTDVLVSTTVVEVGVDVPNATVMMIENAERFGLSQLHQLRGRIGRGDKQSYCIFMDKSEKKDGKNERLEIMNSTNDGFKIASEDLKLRGPGDMFGLRQSGELLFKIGDIFADADILKKASDYADSHKDDRVNGMISGGSLYGGIL